jgi:hypothetical protein
MGCWLRLLEFEMTTQTLIELRKLVDIFGQESGNDGYKDRPMSNNTYEAKTMLLNALEAQAAELAALKADAERYKWLKDSSGREWDEEYFPAFMTGWLDEAIDKNITANITQGGKP